MLTGSGIPVQRPARTRSLPEPPQDRRSQPHEQDADGGHRHLVDEQLDEVDDLHLGGLALRRRLRSEEPAQHRERLRQAQDEAEDYQYVPGDLLHLPTLPRRPRSEAAGRADGAWEGRAACGGATIAALGEPDRARSPATTSARRRRGVRDEPRRRGSEPLRWGVAAGPPQAARLRLQVLGEGHVLHRPGQLRPSLERGRPVLARLVVAGAPQGDVERLGGRVVVEAVVAQPLGQLDRPLQRCEARVLVGVGLGLVLGAVLDEDRGRAVRVRQGEARLARSHARDARQALDGRTAQVVAQAGAERGVELFYPGDDHQAGGERRRGVEALEPVQVQLVAVAGDDAVGVGSLLAVRDLEAERAPELQGVVDGDAWQGGDGPWEWLHGARSIGHPQPARRPASPAGRVRVRFLSCRRRGPPRPRAGSGPARAAVGSTPCLGPRSASRERPAGPARRSPAPRPARTTWSWSRPCHARTPGSPSAPRWTNPVSPRRSTRPPKLPSPPTPATSSSSTRTLASPRPTCWRPSRPVRTSSWGPRA